MKYRPFKHLIASEQVTWLSDAGFELSEFDQFLSLVTADEYLCGMPLTTDNEVDPLSQIEVIKHGKMDEELLAEIYKRMYT